MCLLLHVPGHPTTTASIDVSSALQTDPEAARMVFESGVPLTMVPLEVTHTALATTSVLQVGGCRCPCLCCR